MKVQTAFSRRFGRMANALTLGLIAGLSVSAMLPAYADETCASPYMKKITGQEDFVYVWTLGVEGLGDGQDKLVTVDVNPKSKQFGKVTQSLSVGGRMKPITLTSRMIGVFSGPVGLIPQRSSSLTSKQIPQNRSSSGPLRILWPKVAVWWVPTPFMPSRGA